MKAPHLKTAVSERIAAAPISWGVCEVPGWGFQLDPDLVLTQMRDIGVTATEFGPDGFLPDAPEAKAATLERYGLAAVGQFVPVVLHDADHDPLPQVQAAVDGLVAAGAGTVVIAAATGSVGYDTRPTLDDTGWARLLGNLDRIAELAARQGLVAVLHPHVGTMIESGEETERVLAGSSVGICLDTGHLLIGGGDPVALAAGHPGRIRHVHLKDVRLSWAQRVQDGTVSYADAVARGMYAPLGQGDIDVRAIVTSLEDAGYDGWYVLEQDTVLEGDPATSPGATDPVADTKASIAHLLALAGEGAD